jgi:hypothetical protein
MIKQKLLKDLNLLGFPLMETKEEIDVNKTLAEVVKSRELRLWEGFPVLLANSAKESQFDYKKVLKELKKKEDRENFMNLLLISLALYKHKHLSFNWTRQLKDQASNLDTEKLKKFRNFIVHKHNVVIANKQVSTERVLDIFSNYFKQDAKETRRIKEKYEELSLEYALSQIFSPKQKELFKKKLSGESFTKTEKEYYSRTVKKKVQALANPELHRLAQKLMEY